MIELLKLGEFAFRWRSDSEDSDQRADVTPVEGELGQV
jgi:hypothetical protein